MLNKIRAMMSEIATVLVEREQAIELAIIALLTREHLLMLGPPGTAKSLLVRELCKRVTGVTYFEKLLTKFSTPEELFGPLSLSALEKDQYKRITKGALQEAQIAFIDECYKANSAILNSLLTIINERLYQESGEVTEVPLISLFGASNESPEDDSLQALHDRFILRYVVSTIANDDNFKCMLLSSSATPAVTLTQKELLKAQSEVDQVVVTESMLNAFVSIRQSLAKEGISISDRRWRACVKIVQAKAWLDGDSEATADHCEILQHVLWMMPEHIKVATRVVMEVTNPISLKAVEMEDAARDLYQTLTQTASQQSLEPVIQQLTDIYNKLRVEANGVPEKKLGRVRQALSSIEGWHKDVARRAFELISTYSDLR